jgi:hypothetical protein
MTEQFVQQIDEALAGATGEVLDKSRATDRLLDLRLAADTPALVAAVDDVLTSIPGRTMVPTSWLIDALNGLRLAAELEGERAAAG